MNDRARTKILAGPLLAALSPNGTGGRRGATR
jgi:hypothetical protein